jgi:hypothetical protein
MSGISTGNSTAGKANVDSGHNLNVALPLTPAQVGSVRLMSENDAGDIIGTPSLASPETSSDARLRVGMDTVIFSDEFTATTQNTDKWNYTFVTLTAAQPGAGTVNFGAVQGTAATHGAFMRTSQYFPLFNTAPLAVEFVGGQFNAPLVAGEVWLAGLGAPVSAIARPTDGAWLKLTTAGLIGVLSFGGVETETGVLIPFGDIAVGGNAKYLIVAGERFVQFWVDDILVGSIDTPSGNGSPWQGASAPVFMMKYCTSVVSNTNTMRVSRVGVSITDVSFQKTAADVAAAQGKHSSVGQNGHTMGSTAANFGAVILPTTVAIANNSVGAAFVGLGGLFLTTTQATNISATGDNIAQSYQNPSPTINITGRNLIITGMSIYAMNTGAAVATTPTSLIWGLAYGHSAASLATTETGSFVTATTRAPRRIPLGMMTVPVGAAIGACYDTEIVRQFVAPVVVHPGEFFATTVRFRIGTATASQELCYTIGFEGYWE